MGMTLEVHSPKISHSVPLFITSLRLMNIAFLYFSLGTQTKVSLSYFFYKTKQIPNQKKLFFLRLLFEILPIFKNIFEQNVHLSGRVVAWELISEDLLSLMSRAHTRASLLVGSLQSLSTKNAPSGTHRTCCLATGSKMQLKPMPGIQSPPTSPPHRGSEVLTPPMSLMWSLQE